MISSVCYNNLKSDYCCSQGIGGKDVAESTLAVLIEKDEDGIFVASVPALKGCQTQAKTMDELLVRIQQAIELCLEVEKDELYFNQFVGVQQIEVQL